MGELDKKYISSYDGNTMWSTGTYQDNLASVNNAQSILDAGVGEITSRDQIINPAALIQPNMFRNTARGRAQYEAMYNSLVNLQKQQEAAYKEYYDSPQQAALREREAGLNPDLIGLQNAGESAEAPANENVPGQNLPTIGQQVMTYAQSFTTMIQGLQGIADLRLYPKKKANLQLANKNLGLENNLLELAEIASTSELVDSWISDSLATAEHEALERGEIFDPIAYLSNQDNFKDIESTFTGISPYLSNIVKSARGRALRYRKESANLMKDFASGNFDFAKIYNNPLYDTNQRLMAAQMGPYMQMLFKADEAEARFRKVYAEWQTAYQNAMDPNTAAGAIVAQQKYTKAYYDELDGKLVAAFEQYVRDVEQGGLDLTKIINDNYKSMYNSDPTGEAGAAAQYLFSTNGGMNWQDNYIARNHEVMSRLMESDVKLKERLAANEVWKRYDMIHKNINGSIQAAGSVLGGAAKFVGK